MLRFEGSDAVGHFVNLPFFPCRSVDVRVPILEMAKKTEKAIFNADLIPCFLSLPFWKRLRMRATILLGEFMQRER